MGTSLAGFESCVFINANLTSLSKGDTWETEYALSDLGLDPRALDALMASNLTGAAPSSISYE